MAGASLLTLIDDIATVLDDVAILSKVAVKKTAGVLGDDLALNAEQVSGVKADRELPVVWAVAKGSFLNKLILVPSALLISAFMPPLITVLLVLGGLFLCFEGFEKVSHKFFHSKKALADEHQALIASVNDESVDIVALEKEKIKGAIRTDFILSAEIIVIVLGSVKEAAFETQVIVVSALAIVFTVGVYGLVAGIVKIDDLGLHLLKKPDSARLSALQKAIGRGLLVFAPFLMKLLTIVGTIAMFLVGGGIIVHSFSWLSRTLRNIGHGLSQYLGAWSEIVLSILFDGIIGMIAGGVVLAGVSLLSRLKKQHITAK